MTMIRNDVHLRQGRFAVPGGIGLFLFWAVVGIFGLPSSAETFTEESDAPANASANAPVNASGQAAEAIPAWAQREIAETLGRFKAWRGDDVTVVFPVVTDVHSETVRNATAAVKPTDGAAFFSASSDTAASDSASSGGASSGGASSGGAAAIDWSDSKNHILIAQRAAILFDADCLVDLGDIGIDRYNDYRPSAPEDLFWRLAAQLRLYQDFTAVPLLFALGNHDRGNDAFPISSETYGSAFNGLAKRRGVPLVTGPNLDYGYYDLPEKDCRLFFLNSSDEGYYGFSRAQLQFLADSLRLPDGWTALICQHFCVERSIGLWRSFPHVRANRGEVWTAILEGFLAGGSGEKDGVVWDFRQNRDCRLAGCVAGDSHFDNQGRVRGVNYVITQGFGLIQKEQLPDGAVDTPFDRGTQTLIDVVAVKPLKQEMRLFRIGAGGADRDRSLFFGDPPQEGESRGAQRGF